MKLYLVIMRFKCSSHKICGLYLTISSWQLGGVSSLLAGMPATIPVVSKVPTLILGMDVSHGSPGQSDIPSIAAVKCFNIPHF